MNKGNKMIFKLKNVVDAAQITVGMFRGEEQLPNNVYRLCDTKCGTEIGIPQLRFKDKTILKVGDWIVNSIFFERVLSNEEFKKWVKI